MASAKPGDRTKLRPPVTGLRLPRELVKELKHLAVDSDRTLREVVIGALQEYAAKYRKRA